MDKNIIFETIKEIFVSEFQVNAELVTPENRLEDDLGLDSLDMVEVLNCLKDYIGEKVDPGMFKEARTVQNAVDLLQHLWK